MPSRKLLPLQGSDNVFKGYTILERLKGFVGRMAIPLFIERSGPNPCIGRSSHGDAGEVEAYVHTLLISALVIGG
jgi:hypothetical protein